MADRLQDQHFILLTRLMEQHTGIQLPPTKRAMIEGRLRKRVRVLGLRDLHAYGVGLFEDGLIEDEFDLLVDCMTTNKTDFFREPDHFDFLKNTAVPALLGLRQRAGIDLKIWSAACSTGAEAYTIAMVLADLAERGARMRFSVLGTDICGDVVEQARRAIYPAAMLDAVPPDLRRRYVMEAVDAARAESRIVPELRELVTFRHLNLMDKSYPFDRDIDVIFCRNILIYFARPVQQAVLTRLSSHLRPGGYLILGHSESFGFDENSSMTAVCPTVFQRSESSDLKGRAA